MAETTASCDCKEFHTLGDCVPPGYAKAGCRQWELPMVPQAGAGTLVAPGAEVVLRGQPQYAFLPEGHVWDQATRAFFTIINIQVATQGQLVLDEEQPASIFTEDSTHLINYDPIPAQGILQVRARNDGAIAMSPRSVFYGRAKK